MNWQTIHGWVQRGLRGVLNMLESAVKEGDAPTPNWIEELKKDLQRLSALVDRLENQQK